MAGHVLSVLIIDDDEDDFVLTGGLLRDIQSWTCTVEWADSVDAASAEIRARCHDVYLVDYRMGARSGLDVLHLLREQGCRSPAILLTGVDNREVDLAAMQLGAADYLVKSELSTVVLERSLRYALERARLLGEVEQARQEAETLFALSTALEQAANLEDMMQGAGALLMKVAGVDAFLLWEIREERAFLTHIQGELGHPVLAHLPAGHEHTGLPHSQAPLWQVVRERTPLYIEDMTIHAHLLELSRVYGYRSAAHIPLVVNGKLHVLSYLRRAGRAWAPHERRLLEAGGRSIGVALERHQNLELLATAALTDGLTGLGNRRAFDEALGAALNSAARHGYPVSLVSFDLDGLKAINDREGHARGDEFLRAFAQKMKAALRREDLLYRFGGDEFTAVLNHTGPAGFGAVLRRVRTAMEAVQQTGFPHVDVSAGIAAYPAEAAGAGELLRLSDERMYEEKLRHRAQRG